MGEENVTTSSSNDSCLEKGIFNVWIEEIQAYHLINMSACFGVTRYVFYCQSIRREESLLPTVAAIGRV